MVLMGSGYFHAILSQETSLRIPRVIPRILQTKCHTRLAISSASMKWRSYSSV